MKHYIPLLISLMCTTAYTMEHGMSLPAVAYATIRYYNPNASPLAPNGQVTVAITPEITLYEIQDQIRNHIGSGDLKVGSMRIGEHDANTAFARPLINRYDSPVEAQDAIERFYAFWLD